MKTPYEKAKAEYERRAAIAYKALLAAGRPTAAVERLIDEAELSLDVLDAMLGGLPKKRVYLSDEAALSDEEFKRQMGASA